MVRGKKPKPTHLKLVTGNPGKRALNRSEPKPRRERPSAPAHLSENAREAWKRIVPVLDEMGVLTRADAMAVEMLCEAYADYLAARAELKEFGGNYYVTEGRNGVMRRSHPAVSVMQDADRRIKAWLTEFGLTPSARTRVHAEIVEEDEEDKFFT